MQAAAIIGLAMFVGTKSMDGDLDAILARMVEWILKPQ